MSGQEDSLNAASPARSRQRILVADDDSVIQMLVTAFLEKAGYVVAQADDGQQAVAAAARHPFDLILIDLNMPVMGGAEAAGLIRADEAPGRRTPIIALTATTSEAERACCLAAGIDALLAKPLDRDRLLETVTRFAGPPR